MHIICKFLHTFLIKLLNSSDKRGGERKRMVFKASAVMLLNQLNFVLTKKKFKFVGLRKVCYFHGNLEKKHKNGVEV